MVISGMIIETVQNKAEVVALELEKIKGVEVHRIMDGYRLVVTIEAETVDKSYVIADSFKDMDYLLTVCLAYLNYEDDPSAVKEYIEQ